MNFSESGCEKRTQGSFYCSSGSSGNFGQPRAGARAGAGDGGQAQASAQAGAGRHGCDVDKARHVAHSHWLELDCVSGAGWIRTATWRPAFGRAVNCGREREWATRGGDGRLRWIRALVAGGP